MKKTALITSALFALPVVAFAQDLGPIRTFIDAIARIINLLVPMLITLAIVAFFYGLVKYIWGSGKGHDAGKNIMIAGIASLFVMVSLWGIVQLAQGALGVNGNVNSLPTPKVQYN